jgi:hypothetical protein
MAGCPDYPSAGTTRQALPGRQTLWTSARSGATVDYMVDERSVQATGA